MVTEVILPELLDSPLDSRLDSPLVESRHDIKLPEDIRDSSDPEDQVVRETAHEINRLTTLMEARHMQSHVMGQMVSRKIQGLKVLGDQLAARRLRQNLTPIQMMAALVQCVQHSLTDAGIREDQQRVIINALASKLEEAQHLMESPKKLPG